MLASPQLKGGSGVAIRVACVGLEVGGGLAKDMEEEAA